MTTTTAPFTRFQPPLAAATPELSVVMPCLNEADTIAIVHPEGAARDRRARRSTPRS